MMGLFFLLSQELWSFLRTLLIAIDGNHLLDWTLLIAIDGNHLLDCQFWHCLGQNVFIYLVLALDRFLSFLFFLWLFLLLLLHFLPVLILRSSPLFILIFVRFFRLFLLTILIIIFLIFFLSFYGLNFLKILSIPFTPPSRTIILRFLIRISIWHSPIFVSLAHELIHSLTHVHFIFVWVEYYCFAEVFVWWWWLSLWFTLSSQLLAQMGFWKAVLVQVLLLLLLWGGARMSTWISSCPRFFLVASFN